MIIIEATAAGGRSVLERLHAAARAAYDRRRRHHTARFGYHQPGHHRLRCSADISREIGRYYHGMVKFSDKTSLNKYCRFSA